MRNLFLLFICLNFTSTITFGQSAARDAVLELEAQRFAAMTRKDTVLLKNLLAEDLVYMHSNGLIETKPAHLMSIGSGKITYISMERVPGTRVRQYGKWCITNGAVYVKGLLNGVAFDIQLLYTAVYQKRKRKWQLVNWQSTRI